MVSDGDNGDVCQLRMLVSPFEKNDASEDTFKVITHELKRHKWMDPKVMDLVFKLFSYIEYHERTLSGIFASIRLQHGQYI